MDPRRTPTVSVLMAMHDAAETVERAITSCLEQTLEDWELVVVDDASTDGSARLVHAASDPRVRLVQLAENRGPGAARNLGLEHARGRWLTVLDADDAYLPTRLERLASLAEELADERLVYVDRVLRVVATPEGFVALGGLPDELPVGHRVLDPAEAFRSGAGGQPLFSRELLQISDARYPETVRSGEDTAFLLRLLAVEGARFVRILDPLYVYTMRSSSLTASTGRHAQREAALRPLLTDGVLPEPLRAAVEDHLAMLKRERGWELLRDAVRDRAPLRAATTVLRHPGVIAKAARHRRAHQQYRAAIDGAMRAGSGSASADNVGVDGAAS